MSERLKLLVPLFCSAWLLSGCDSPRTLTEDERIANSLALVASEQFVECKLHVRMISVAATMGEASNVLKAARGAERDCNLLPSDFEKMSQKTEACKRMANHGYVGAKPLIEFLQEEINSIEYGATNSAAHFNAASLAADECDGQIADIKNAKGVSEKTR